MCGAVVEEMSSAAAPPVYPVAADVGAGMGFFDGLLGSRSADFDSGSAASNAIELTKRHHQVSLTKQARPPGTCGST